MRIQVFIVIALMVSKIVVSVVYLGYRVADASSKGMLPLDAELLKSDWQAILANTAYGSIVVAIMCLIYYAVKRRKLNVHINKNSISCPLVINWCIFTLALGFGLRMTLSYLIYFAVQTGILDDTNAMIQTVETSSSSIEYLIQLLVFTIIVPIYEELFFRKMFVNDLMNVYERKKAIIIALLGFIMLHTGANVFYSIAVGAVAMFVYLKYGNILLGILVHAAFNFAGFTNIPFVNEFPAITDILYGLSVAICVCYIIFFIRKNKKRT